MLLRLAEMCKYDRWTRPGSKKEPLQVHTRIYVYFLGSIEAHYLVRNLPKLSLHFFLKNCSCSHEWVFNFLLQNFSPSAFLMNSNNNFLIRVDCYWNISLTLDCEFQSHLAASVEKIICLGDKLLVRCVLNLGYFEKLIHPYFLKMHLKNFNSYVCQYL